jgi:Secretion system C-terminal sorting domain
LYQTDIYYNRGNQTWYGYGPDEGHTSWKFDAAGKVISPGDIIFTGEFQSSTLTNIEARIWVSKAVWASTTPTQFNWGGAIQGASSGSLYGYANILPNTSGPFYTGIASQNNTWAGPFQLVLQNNALVTDYVKDQFIEFSVNMTKLGLDPVTTFGTDICGTPFNRLVVKTRASAEFDAQLKDFVAPTDLFLAPRVAALADVPLFCNLNNVSTIQVQDPYPSSNYTWSTTDGHIVGTNSGTSIVVDSPGTYIVTQRLTIGCNPYAYDTVTVAYDPNCTTLDNNLFSFKGVINNSVTRLDWSVAQNGNISYYEIERSFDGRFFEFVNRVNADPDQQLSASYISYDDLTHQSLQPAVFYRLKIRTTAGATSYSKIIRIPYGFAVTKVSVAPNPVHDMMQITINTADKDLMELYLYDMSGKIIRKINTDLQSGTNVVSIDNISNLQSGMYLVVVSTSKETFRQKIVLAK